MICGQQDSCPPIKFPGLSVRPPTSALVSPPSAHNWSPQLVSPLPCSQQEHAGVDLPAAEATLSSVIPPVGPCDMGVEFPASALEQEAVLSKHFSLVASEASKTPSL